jgi:hypothetical protein
MLKEALAKSKSKVSEPISKMQSILKLALRTTKENYCFESLNPGRKAFVRGLICPCCKTEGTFSRHGTYWK